MLPTQAEHVQHNPIAVSRILAIIQEFVPTRSYPRIITNATVVIRILEGYVTREFLLATLILVNMTVYAVMKMPIHGTSAAAPSRTKVQTARLEKTCARRMQGRRLVFAQQS